MTSKVEVKRPRNAWFFYVTNVMGVNQLEIGYKNTEGDIGPFSLSKKNISVKVPFGPPNLSEYRVRTVGNSGDSVGEFKFVNKRNEVATFAETILNHFESGIDMFSKKVTSLIIENKKDLLVLYLTIMQHSATFVFFVEDVYDNDGIHLDGFGIQESRLLTSGGSLEDYRSFLKVALESAKVIANPDEGHTDIRKYFVSKGKRKNIDSSIAPSKMYKQAVIDSNERKELGVREMK